LFFDADDPMAVLHFLSYQFGIGYSRFRTPEKIPTCPPKQQGKGELSRSSLLSGAIAGAHILNASKFYAGLDNFLCPEQRS
jgi:hypothetical protein